MLYKRMTILANSRKHSGRCLAGRKIVNEVYVPGWIRPISDRAGAEVSEYERQYQDGTFPRLLDVVDVPLISVRVSGCHTENWLLSPEHYWIKKGKADWNNASSIAENPLRLWNTGDSTYNGLNDQIERSAAAGFNTSITMISVASVEIHVLVPGANFGNPKKRVQARFEHRGVDYWLWVTDPAIESKYLASADNLHRLGRCLLTISLAELFETKSGSYHYKLVAAIMEKPVS